MLIAAREQLTKLLPALDLKGLAAFTPAPPSAASHRSSSVAQQTLNRFPVAQDGQWGYIDSTGTLVIEPQFYGARRYSGGRAPVLVDGFVFGKWGFIDESGDMVIEPQFEEALPFAEERAAVSVDDDWGYVDKQGRHVIDSSFLDRARTFSSGRAAVEHNFDGWMFLDRTGERVLEGYDYAEPFRGPLARVADDVNGTGHFH